MFFVFADSFILGMEWYVCGITKVSLIWSLLWHTLVSTLSAERIREDWGKSGCCWGVVTGVRFTPFVFLQPADTAVSLLKIYTWHDAPSCSASACTFLEITCVWTMVHAGIKDPFTSIRRCYFKGQIMPWAGFCCSLLFTGDKLIVLPVISCFPVFAVPRTFSCHKNSQVAFAQTYTGELLNVNCLVDKWGLVAVFNYAAFCNVSPTGIHLVDSNYS